MSDENLTAVRALQIRVDVRWGTGVPLALCNGIGRGLEVLGPAVARWILTPQWCNSTYRALALTGFALSLAIPILGVGAGKAVDEDRGHRSA
jgi:hypothetical protein